MTLAGKVALVTGGGRGIGRATSLRLAEAGADVYVNYFRNREPAEATAEEIRAHGVRAWTVRANVGDPDAIEGLFAQIAGSTGGIDILVSNAASGVLRPALDLEVKHWDWTLNINARAMLLLAQQAAPGMIERGWGCIVGVSSLGSHLVLNNYAAVGISKAAIETLTRYLAAELAPRGVRVNAVSGSYVETDALKHFPNREEMLRAARERTPTGKMLEPDDLARVIVFLCSDGAEQICGQTIVVDGGYSLLA
jgi:enoyl-[acyl-carrier protein] reductase III